MQLEFIATFLFLYAQAENLYNFHIILMWVGGESGEF